MVDTSYKLAMDFCFELKLEVRVALAFLDNMAYVEALGKALNVEVALLKDRLPLQSTIGSLLGPITP